MGVSSPLQLFPPQLTSQVQEHPLGSNVPPFAQDSKQSKRKQYNKITVIYCSYFNDSLWILTIICLNLFDGYQNLMSNSSSLQLFQLQLTPQVREHLLKVTGPSFAQDSEQSGKKVTTLKSPE